MGGVWHAQNGICLRLTLFHLLPPPLPAAVSATSRLTSLHVRACATPADLLRHSLMTNWNETLALAPPLSAFILACYPHYGGGQLTAHLVRLQLQRRISIGERHIVYQRLLLFAFDRAP